MTIEKLKTWNTWVDHDANPLITPEPPEWIIADPTFIPPNESPDKKWHLFAHGILNGIYHFISDDGFKWKNTGYNLSSGLRPFLYKEGNVYYLLYEKMFTPLYGSIVLCKSSDLYNWADPKHILTPSLSWEGRISRRVGNPCLIKNNTKYRLYYSAGTVFLWDSIIPEPRYIGIAEAANIEGPYEKNSNPIIGPSKNHKYRNIGAGAIKVLQFNDLWVGFNNGIYKDRHGRSRSSILLLHSNDGLNWNDVFERPIIYPTKGWKSAFVYQLDVKRIDDEYRLYYNARDGWFRGSERIGLARLKIK